MINIKTNHERGEEQNAILDLRSKTQVAGVRRRVMHHHAIDDARPRRDNAQPLPHDVERGPGVPVLRGLAQVLLGLLRLDVVLATERTVTRNTCV